MENKNINIEDRIKALKGIYTTIDDFFEKYGQLIPEKGRSVLKDKILGDEQLKELMDGLGKQRPPRILLVGRTGVGKSSLINALCGSYVAPVNDVRSCTTHTSIYQCTDNGRILMEIMDSRGIAESASLDVQQSAEAQLLEDVKHFLPDVVLLLLPANVRDNVDKDIIFLHNLQKEHYSENFIKLPIITVLNKVDGVAPARMKNPAEYPEGKLRNIEQVKAQYRKYLAGHDLQVDSLIEVSSLIDWMNTQGNEVVVSDIESMSEKEISQLQIGFDGRYHINELRETMELSIQDSEAVMGLKMALRLEEVVSQLTKKFITIFSGIAGTIAVIPIPISDIFILIGLQATMVSVIAALSGRTVTLESGLEFIVALGGVGGIGKLLQLVAQQSSKLVNLIVPGAGSLISAGIATIGTQSIGYAAKSYFIDGEDLKKAKKELKKMQKELKKQKKN